MRCAAELVDRYGPIPPTVENLLAVARFKVVCRGFGVREVSLQGNSVRFSPLDLPESGQLRLQRLYDRASYKQTVGTVTVPPSEGRRESRRGRSLRSSSVANRCATSRC